eukprot:scaffold284265_cov30-Tisochrysis_lutea.AAC.2
MSAALALTLLSSPAVSFPRSQLKQVPLPIKLAGGFILFRNSVAPENRVLAAEALKLAQAALNADPRVTSELGAGLEAGGVFASAASACEEGQIFEANFQLSGGNLWAEATVRGIQRSCSKVDRSSARFELLELTVSNMDAAMMGGEPSCRVALPVRGSSDDFD